MSSEQIHTGEFDIDTHFPPFLICAVTTWYEAMQRFQRQQCEQNQTAYCKATDELGQAISHWQIKQPKLVEQFAFWFRSHGLIEPLSNEQIHNGELVLKSCFLPSLDVAIKRWYAARHRFQSQPDEQSLEDYGGATNILYLAFERAYEDDLRTPDAFEEFRASLIRAEEVDPMIATAK